MKPIVIITGATATGKTQASLDLASYLEKKSIKSEIVNYDSLIFYKDLNIGTAKPTEQELRQVPHHLINCRYIDDPLNASSFREEALKIINQLHEQNIIPICVGGSAFYIRALIKGMYDSLPASKEVSDQLERVKNEQGIHGLRELLKSKDPESYASIHPNDEYRTTRALEHYLTHGTKFSIQKTIIDNNKPYDFSLPQEKNWTVINHYFSIPKEEHWGVMKARVEKMIQLGLIEEVQELLQKGYSTDLSPLKSVGYKETLQFLADDGSIGSIMELIEAIYIATRQLAKSQKTFFKKITPKLEHNPLLTNTQYCDQTLSFLEELGVSK